jgi:VIT1/CCC1 family predicted Fe2+/Mn2+ transporter
VPLDVGDGRRGAEEEVDPGRTAGRRFRWHRPPIIALRRQSTESEGASRRRVQSEEMSNTATHPPQARGAGEAVGEHHRDIQGGAIRAGVFGVSDGLLTNISLILGVAGANPAAGIVRLAGLAGLVAGAFSMAAGEYVSMRAQSELIHRELAIERQALLSSPDEERAELIAVYEGRGVPPAIAASVADALMRDPDIALEVHSREELGVDPARTGSPWRAAGSSFVSFAVGAIVPLVPWFFLSGGLAVAISIVLGAAAALSVGGIVGHFSGRSIVRGALRQILIAAVAAAVTFGIGRAVGVSTGA